MRVLGIDTATWTAAVGVVESGRILAERTAEASRSHAACLPSLVAAVLSDAGLTLTGIAGVAVSAGPGSFTGLRIGVAFAKGLAFAGGIPLVGVSTLEAYASRAEQADGTLVCVANDARKGELYAALFRARGRGAVERCWPDRAWRPGELLAALPDEAVVMSDACAMLAADGQGIRHRCFPCVPSGGAVACLGAAAFERGEQSRVGDFEPTYVRAPDAMPPRPPVR